MKLDRFEKFSTTNENFENLQEILNNSPAFIMLVTMWILKGKFKYKNVKDNLEVIYSDFIKFCNLMGYTIDKKALDEKLISTVKKVKETLKIK